MATFEVSQSYEVPTEIYPKGGRRIDLAALKERAKNDAKLDRILRARGIYIFSIRAGRGSKPWYVGKSEKSTLLAEGFNTRNLTQLNDLICKRSGTLLVTFVTQVRTPGRPNKIEIGKMEYLFIGYAAERNKDLLNVHGTKKETFEISGVYNSKNGRPTKTQQDFKALMGI